MFSMEQIVGLCVYFSLTDWTINTPPTPADLSFHKQEKYKYNTNVISWKHKYKYMINHNWSLGSQLLGQYDLDPILTGTLTENLRGKRTNKILYLMCVTVSWHEYNWVHAQNQICIILRVESKLVDDWNIILEITFPGKPPMCDEWQNIQFCGEQTSPQMHLQQPANFMPSWSKLSWSTWYQSQLN